jgi:hypothetical protein
LVQKISQSANEQIDKEKQKYIILNIVTKKMSLYNLKCKQNGKQKQIQTNKHKTKQQQKNFSQLHVKNHSFANIFLY